MQKKKTGGNLLLLCSVLALCFVSPVYANEVTTKIESLSDFLFADRSGRRRDRDFIRNFQLWRRLAGA